LFALFSGGLLGSLVMIPMQLARRGKLLGVVVPFGPFLAAGALLYLFFGRSLIAMWMS
jgi:leader peptidase (prepilin peptidase)/N-methyltransferase